jgi:dihydrofolate reductase
MRNITLIMTMSIDGFVVAPKGVAVGAQPEPVALKRWKLDRIYRAGTHIMGRITYAEMARFWPTSNDEYAAPMNEIPKVVFSKSLKEATWPESVIASGNLADEIAALKRKPGGEIIAWGGADFVQALSKAGLVDEYAIVTKPIAYGGGKPMFRDLSAGLQLKALATTIYEDGTLLRLYHPK